MRNASQTYLSKNGPKKRGLILTSYRPEVVCFNRQYIKIIYLFITQKNIA